MVQGDDALLASVPDFISLGGLMKATPNADGARRFLFLEASNEDVDHQNEISLQKALGESSDYYLRHGNLDISHYTILGPQRAGPDYLDYEIGKPMAVRVDGKRTFVKAELYRGESAQGRKATMVWESLTKQQPPMTWYPSVGGAVLAKSVRIDPVTSRRVAVVEKVRWNNIALDRTPVNATVPEASLSPLGVFAKSLNAFVMKGLTAGYGTDSATLSGGGAMREQSLAGAPANYWDFRNKLASHIRDGKVGRNPGTRELIDHCGKTFQMSHGDSAEWVERFLTDLNTGRKRRAS